MIYDNKFPIKLLKSNLNEVYLGIELSANVIETYLNTFREIVGEEKYHLFTSKRKERDGDMCHITVISPNEYEDLYKNKSFDKETDNYDIEFIGIGMVSDDANEAYYIIVESKALQAFRKDAGLGKRDLHVTLGFKIEDIHHLSKAANTKI